MTERPIYTYQTRLTVTAEQSAQLDRYAALHGQIQRTLFAALKAGRDLNELKVEFCAKYGVTARQFNALRIELDGKTQSITERRKSLLTEATARIKKAEKVVKKLAERAPGSFKLHHKKRRLATLKSRQSAMQRDHDAGEVRLCFGSKKLFHAQFDLEANGYASHAEWRTDWQRSRSEQFFVVGSGDETAGNQTCQASANENGALTLQLRLPDALESVDKRLAVTQVRFAHGHDDISAALASSENVSAVSASGRITRKRTGTPLSYRFLRDEKGWRVFVLVMAAPVAVASSKLLGAIGIDINADHLAVAETDRFGNLARALRLDAVTYGKSQDQSKAILGDVSKEIAKLALLAGKPVAIERLDFTKETQI